MAAVVSEGQLVQSSRVWSPPLNRGIQLYDHRWADYAWIWRTQPNVRTVTSFLGRNIAQVSLRHYRQVSPTERQPQPMSALSKLLRRPMPQEFKWTRFMLVNFLVQSLCIYDDAFALLIQTDSGSAALVPVPTIRMMPWGANWMRSETYMLQGNAQRLEFPAEQVMHFHGFNPIDLRVGVSPMETLRRILSEEDAAGAYRERFWSNSARMEQVVKRPAAAPKWSDGAYERFKAEWQALYSGTHNSGSTAILEDGMDLMPIGWNAKDSEYLGARKLTREEVCAAFHVPQPFVGILDHATFSNIEEQHKDLYQDTLGPWFTDLSEALELQLAPQMPGWEDDTDYLEFDIEEKLMGSFEEEAAQLQTAVGAPWLTRAEARARRNLPPIPGADQLVTPLNVLVGGQASPTDNAPPSGAPKGGRKARTDETRMRDRHVEKHQEVLGKFIERQKASVLSKVGAKSRGRKAVSADDIWDGDRWDGELADELYGLQYSTTKDFGDAMAKDLGGEFDIDTRAGVLPYLKAGTTAAAKLVNQSTFDEIEAALADAEDDDEAEDPTEAVKGVFDGLVSSRMAQLAVSTVTLAANFGRSEGAKSAGARTKTWVVTSDSPRPSHAAIDGETVGIDEDFSLGGKWPGDPDMDVDETAGCTCIADFSTEDSQ